MASFMNQAEPFEESQGSSATTKVSADALKAFYSEMERKELVQRKLSRGKSSSGKSLWSRKSTKQTAPSLGAVDDGEGEKDMDGFGEDQNEKYDQVPSMLTRSIIPDPLGELPAWFGKEHEWSSANPNPIISYRTRYPIHNPVGPKWYKNWHLIPPSQLRTASRPPSVFSPSFPPMTQSQQESPTDSSRAPDPSRTSSASPLPTPNSSQSGLAEAGGRVRTRKNSLTAHDEVDLLDVSDPWGNNWHHQSPYDPGLESKPVTVDVPEQGPSKARPRISSMTTGRHKTVAPSPLSQSTSAIHLQPPETDSQLPRKLSKRRRPILGGLFGSSSDDSAASVPATPIYASMASQRDQIGRRHSAMPQSTASLLPSSASVPSQFTGDKREKRGSVLGRLVKKFSIVRRPTRNSGEGGRASNEWHTTSLEPRPSNLTRDSSAENPEKGFRKSMEPSKRVPPPSVDHNGSTEPGINDRASSISVETPLSGGRRLTVANPDAISSGEDTPNQANVPLPPVEHHFEPSPSPPTPQVEKPEPELPPLPESDSRCSSPVMQSLPQIPTPPSQSSVLPNARAKLPFSPSVSVPFPSAEQMTLSPPALSSARLSVSGSNSANDSPLSRASLYVNPPTPQVPVALMPVVSSFPPPTVQTSREQRRSTRDSSPTKIKPESSIKDDAQRVKSPVTSRETETFRLVRTPSGNVQNTGATITAGGEQWSIVESQTPRRSKTKDSSKPKERDSDSRREQKKQERAKAEADEQRRAKSQSRHRSVNGRITDQSSATTSSSSRAARARSLDTEEHVLEKRRTRDGERKAADPVTPSLNVNKSHPPPPPPTPGPPLERRGSSGPRPTSQQPSSAELTAMRAREVWEMERLWKGRSMYNGSQPNDVMTSPLPLKDSSIALPLADSVRDDNTMRSGGHGSSHTSFMLPTPFHAQSVSDLSKDVLSPQPTRRPQLANPLPEPPRESTYEPSPLPPVLVNGSNGRHSAEHWIKYTSVTTAH